MNDDNITRQEILKGLNDSQVTLNIARMQFNQVNEPELIDSFVYELNALQARYAYFLRLAKENDTKATYPEHHDLAVKGIK